MKKSGLVFVSVLVLLGGFFALAGCDTGSQSTPEETVTSFMKAFEDKDADKAIELAGSDLAEVDFEVFEAMTDYTIGEVNYLSDREATVNVNMEMEEDGMKMNVDYIFPVFLSEGKWILDYHGIIIDWDKLNMGFDSDDLEFEDEYLDLDELDIDIDIEEESGEE